MNSNITNFVLLLFFLFMKTPKYLIEFTVFLSGAIVMIFEIVGSRVLGPYIWTSVFVWTSLIWIILASLSLWYYLGWKLADYKRNLEILSYIFFVASILLLGVVSIKDDFLIYIINIIPYIKVNSIVSSIVLFAPVSVLLGMVSPYAIRLKINNIENSGSTIGNLYALSTLGSIVGTFGAGFFLIPTFGTNNILFALVIALLLSSLLLSRKYFLKVRLWIFVSILLIVVAYNSNLEVNSSYLDVDTEYSRVWIYDTEYDGDKVRKMRINNSSSSSMYLEKEGLVYEYTKYYHLVSHFMPNFQNVLFIGGAAYSTPKDFLRLYSDVDIDVVEIDPKLTELAKKYFKLEDSPRLGIYHEDARIFLNNTKEKYDVIVGDAFKSHSIPYQLTTQELIQKKYDILNDEGLVILNIISSVNGDKGRFLRAEYKTYKSIFPQVYLFLTREGASLDNVQNLILVAIKSDKIPDFTNADSDLNWYLQNLYTGHIEDDMEILTDDYAPVDYYLSKIIE